jgi:hypothetical protein
VDIQPAGKSAGCSVIAVNRAVAGGPGGALAVAAADGNAAPDEVPGDAGALLEPSSLLDGNGGSKGPKDDGTAPCFERVMQPTSVNDTTSPIRRSFGVEGAGIVRG